MKNEDGDDCDDWWWLVHKNIGASFLCIAVFAFLVRGAVSFHPYQVLAIIRSIRTMRLKGHWMEITLNMPAKEWCLVDPPNSNNINLSVGNENIPIKISTQRHNGNRAPQVQFSHDANGLAASILTHFPTKPTILHLGNTLHDHLGMQFFTTQKELIQLKREAKLTGGFYVDPEAKLVFIIRIRGINAMHPKMRKILQLLHLRQALGKFGIICMEDLIHEIMTVGPHFKEANNFLWPFKLKAPLGGLKKRRNHYVEGGDAGNRENYINELIRRMN
ncbi:hypothetical protein PVL29_012117 [Vitis rotundifolia]|uniref:Large ribosomal subunit protein uL30-like ferredoxin-like fold domain-containing protein n=1 Tax=Vitis rotundifolia TaxID=103349 RepID=A0AA39DQE4_VITRO|nr:hypothetical protein PVL29_012117 [Vitis rotundifolia]